MATFNAGNIKANVSVGTTTTLPPGSPAEVTNSGNAGNAILNFKIPQGEDGTGATELLEAEYNALTQAEQMEDQLYLIKDMPGVPVVKGDKGDRGDQGPPGPMGLQGLRGLDGPMGPEGPPADLNLRGTWDQNTTDYAYKDVVNYTNPSTGETNSYFYNDKVNTGRTEDPLDPNGPWELFVMQGPMGREGPQGPQGPIGPQGPEGPRGSDGQNSGPLGDGSLFIKLPDGTSLGTFTANQFADTTVTVPHFSGNYNDLTNKPTLPNVYDATITIKQNGANVDSFTVNQSGDQTIDLGNTANDATITIKQNGSNLDSFTLNQSTNKTIDLGTTANDATITLQDTNGGAIDTFTVNQATNKTISIPAANDGKLTINNYAGTLVGEFTADQSSNTTVTLPQGFSGDYNDLINKPTFTETFPSFISDKITDGTTAGLIYDQKFEHDTTDTNKLYLRQTERPPTATDDTNDVVASDIVPLEQHQTTGQTTTGNSGLMTYQQGKALEESVLQLQQLVSEMFIPIGSVTVDHQTFEAMNDTQREAQVIADTGYNPPFHNMYAIKTSDNITYVFNVTANAWKLWGSSTNGTVIAQATNSSMGVVLGSTDNGKVSMNLDGTMSVNGMNKDILIDVSSNTADNLTSANDPTNPGVQGILKVQNGGTGLSSAAHGGGVLGWTGTVLASSGFPGANATVTGNNKWNATTLLPYMDQTGGNGDSAYMNFLTSASYDDFASFVWNRMAPYSRIVTNWLGMAWLDTITTEPTASTWAAVKPYIYAYYTLGKFEILCGKDEPSGDRQRRVQIIGTFGGPTNATTQQSEPIIISAVGAVKPGFPCEFRFGMIKGSMPSLPLTIPNGGTGMQTASNAYKALGGRRWTYISENSPYVQITSEQDFSDRDVISIYTSNGGWSKIKLRGLMTSNYFCWLAGDKSPLVWQIDTKNFVIAAQIGSGEHSMTYPCFVVDKFDNPRNVAANNGWTTSTSTGVTFTNLAAVPSGATEQTCNDFRGISDNTITINKNDGTAIDSFTLNSTADKTITLPEMGSSKKITIRANGADKGNFNLNETADKTVDLGTLANDATLTLKNGTSTLGTFTANASVNKEIDLSSLVGSPIAESLNPGATILTNLASTSAVNFTGAANITPGVTGVLPVANGGTARTDSSLPSPSSNVTAIANWQSIISAMPNHSVKLFMVNITSGVTKGTNAPSGWQFCIVRKHDSNTNYHTLCMNWGNPVKICSKNGTIDSTTAWTVFMDNLSGYWGA